MGQISFLWDIQFIIFKDKLELRKFVMGNQTKQAIFNGNFRDKKWQSLTNAFINIPGLPKTVRTTDGTIAADQYIIKVTSQHFDFEREKVIYQQRASSMTGNLVNIFSVQETTCESQSTGFIDALRIRTERIPWRLHEVKDLQVFQALYVLQGAIHGYYEILQHVREPFVVTNQMIGINTFGRVKVWANPNFALNQLLDFKYKIGSVKTMLQQIILIVEFHVKGQCFPDPVRNSLFSSTSICDFIPLMNTIQMLLNYSKEQKVEIGKKLVNSVALNQALKQYAENKQRQRQRQKNNTIDKSANYNNSQAVKQITTNYNQKQQLQTYSVVQFQRKAMKLTENKPKDSIYLNEINRSEIKSKNLEQHSQKEPNFSEYRSHHHGNLGGLVFQKRSIKTYSLSNQKQPYVNQQSMHQNSKNFDQFAQSKIKQDEAIVKKSVIIQNTHHKQSYSGVVKSQIFNNKTKVKNHQKPMNSVNGSQLSIKQNRKIQLRSQKQQISHSPVRQTFNSKQNHLQNKATDPSNVQQNSSSFQRKPIFLASKISQNQEIRQKSDLTASRSLTPTVTRNVKSDLTPKNQVLVVKIQSEAQNSELGQQKKIGQIRRNFIKNQQQELKNHLIGQNNKHKQLKKSQIRFGQNSQHSQAVADQIKRQYIPGKHTMVTPMANNYQTHSTQTQRLHNMNSLNNQNYQNFMSKNESNMYSVPITQPPPNIFFPMQHTDHQKQTSNLGQNAYSQKAKLQDQQEGSISLAMKKNSMDMRNFNSNTNQEQMRRSQLTHTSHFGGIDSGYTLREIKKSGFVSSDKTLNKEFKANRCPIFRVQDKSQKNYTVHNIPENSLQSDKFSFNPNGTTYAVNNSNHAKLAFFSPFKSMNFSQSNQK